MSCRAERINCHHLPYNFAVLLKTLTCRQSVLHFQKSTVEFTFYLDLLLQVCFFPLMLVNVADENLQYPFLHILASVLAWASAVINPFIYAFKNRQYQQAFAKVVQYFVDLKSNLALLSNEGRNSF